MENTCQNDIKDFSQKSTLLVYVSNNSENYKVKHELNMGNIKLENP